MERVASTIDGANSHRTILEEKTCTNRVLGVVFKVTMLHQYEITLAGDKFKGVGQLRDLLIDMEAIKYCSTGSFLSAMLFKRPFKGTFDLLVEDESQAFEIAADRCDVDRKKGTMTFKDDDLSGFKIRVYDTVSRHEQVRNYLIENSNLETCFITDADSRVDKLDIRIPKRGVALMQILLELDGDEVKMAHCVEKIVWSLANVGVATLLRDVRFMPQDLVDQAAELISEVMVEHANKTISALRVHGSEPFRTLSSVELKKFGKPFAALLKA